jgi:hypothetical protein
MWFIPGPSGSRRAAGEVHHSRQVHAEVSPRCVMQARSLDPVYLHSLRPIQPVRPARIWETRWRLIPSAVAISWSLTPRAAAFRTA